MSRGITWYTLKEAEHNCGLKQAGMLKWVEEGLVRGEKDDYDVILVNIDDLKLKVQELTGI
jgi:hypothetical protein